MNREDILAHLNAAGVLVASGPGSRGWWIRRKLEEAWDTATEGYEPEELEGLELLGEVTPQGPSIYADKDGKVYVGTENWVVEAETG